MLFSKDLFGSKLNITIDSENIDESIVNKCFNETKIFEDKYSRFIKGNYLYNLNKNKSSQISGELLSIINLSTKVSDVTDGYFDITVLPLLENIGYGIDNKKLEENIGYKNIEIKDSIITLKNGISIDIGSVGKGYMVDKIFNILHPLYEKFTINFGGDIRIKGSEKIQLEDPLDDKKTIGSIVLNNISIASSSPFKRKTKLGHHLINPKDKNSQNDKLAIYLTHKLSSFSDIFSTALFVCPIEKSIEIINNVKGLEGMIISQKGEIFKSKGFKCELNS